MVVSCDSSTKQRLGCLANPFVLSAINALWKAISSICGSLVFFSPWASQASELHERRNVVVALECSTFSTLMDAAAFEKLGQTDWHQQSAGVLSICILVVAWWWGNFLGRLLPGLRLFYDRRSEICIVLQGLQQKILSLLCDLKLKKHPLFWGSCHNLTNLSLYTPAVWDSANLQKCPMPEFLVLALCITVRADRQTLKHIPWDATEAMLMRNLEGKSCLGWETETSWGEIQVRLGPMLWWLLVGTLHLIRKRFWDSPWMHHVWWNTCTNYFYDLLCIWSIHHVSKVIRILLHIFSKCRNSQFDFCGGTTFFVGKSLKNWDSRKQNSQLYHYGLPWSPLTVQQSDSATANSTDSCQNGWLEFDCLTIVSFWDFFLFFRGVLCFG